MNHPPLTDRELAVVRCISDGLARWKIEEVLNLPNDAVRRVIFRLCERFDCGMYALPDRVAERYPDLDI